MLLSRLLGPLALILGFAAPVAAAQIDLTATLNAKSGKPFTGTFGGLPFSIDLLTLVGKVDTLNVVTIGDVHSAAMDSAILTTVLPVFGAVSVAVLDTLTATFDDASDLFSLSKGGAPFAIATPSASFAWDLKSNLPLTDVDYLVDGVFTLNTAVGVLAFNLGLDGDGSGTGAIAALVAPVPPPAAAPMLLAGVGLMGLGLGRLRRG